MLHLGWVIVVRSAVPPNSYRVRRSRLRRLVRQMVVRWRSLWIMVLAALLLSGCVQYETAIQFSSPHAGLLVQSIRLGEQFSALSGESQDQWFQQLEHRTRQVAGHTRSLSDRELQITIPFANGQDLETKFNQFFSPTTAVDALTGTDPLAGITSQLRLHQNNALLLVRQRLVYDLDLRSLGLASAEGTALLNPGGLLTLQFSLTTPWGARADATNAIVQRQGQTLTWRLQPGQVNHIEAVFWLPSPVGIGGLLIILLVGLGIYLKDQSETPAIAPPTGLTAGMADTDATEATPSVDRA